MIGCGVNVWEPTGRPPIPFIESCILDGTVRLLYDCRRTSTITLVSGAVSAWAPYIGGTAADVLINATASQRPTYVSKDSLLGNLPVVSANRASVQRLLPTTAASAYTLSQPYSLICFCRPDSAVAGVSTVIHDGAVSTNRCEVHRSNGSGNYYMATSTQVNTGVSNTGITKGTVHIVTANGASSSIRVKRSDGSLVTSAALSSGVGSVKGLALFSAYNGTANSTSMISSIMLVTDLSAADIARLDAWSLKLGWP